MNGKRKKSVFKLIKCGVNVLFVKTRNYSKETKASYEC